MRCVKDCRARGAVLTHSGSLNRGKSCNTYVREHEKPTFSSARFYVRPFVRGVSYLPCKRRNREFACRYKQLESAACTSRVRGWKTFKGLIQHLQILLRQVVTTQRKVSQAAARSTAGSGRLCSPVAHRRGHGGFGGKQQNCFPSKNKRSATVPFLGTRFGAKVPPAAQLADNEIETGAGPRRGRTCEPLPCRIPVNPPGSSAREARAL